MKSDRFGRLPGNWNCFAEVRKAEQGDYGVDYMDRRTRGHGEETKAGRNEWKGQNGCWIIVTLGREEN